MKNIKLDFYRIDRYVTNLRDKRIFFLFGFLIGFEVIGQSENLSEMLHISSWFFVIAGILMFFPSIYVMTKYMFPDKFCGKGGMLELNADGITYCDNTSGETKFVDIGSLTNVYLRLLLSSRYLYRRHIFKLKWESGDKIEEGLIIFRKRIPLAFRSILEQWYIRNKRIYEFNGQGERTFLLKSNYSYPEVQELKKKYGIEWVAGPEESL